MPKILWDATLEGRGFYHRDYGIIAIHPYQKRLLIFTSIFHEVIHWAIYRLGDNYVTRWLSAKYDWLDYVLTMGEMPRQT